MTAAADDDGAHWHGMAVAVHHVGCHGPAGPADHRRPVTVCLSTYAPGDAAGNGECWEIPTQVAGELGRALIAAALVADDVQAGLDADRN